MNNFKKNKIFMLGRDNVGWSIDKDRHYIERSLLDLDYIIVDNIFESDVIYCVWWNILNSFKIKYLVKFLRFFGKKVIAAVTNDLKHQESQFLKIKKMIDVWVVANNFQRQFLLDHGINSVNIAYNPFYVDEKVFYCLNLGKDDLCQKLGVNPSVIKGKFLIGNFQRDSLGANLLESKWQKDPELLLNIYKELDHSIFLLVLAGPRRHYLVNKLKELDLPYLFVGNENHINNNVDDILSNNLGLEKINILYNLIDLCIITSKSEGGPKAVIESALTKTPILSTPIGMAPDLLVLESLVSSLSDFVDKVNFLYQHSDYRQKMISDNYEKIIKVNNYDSFKSRLLDVVKKI